MSSTTSWFGSVPSQSFTLVSADTRETTLRHILCSIEGVTSVRVLSASVRAAGARDKIYIVLGTHDIRRDRRIVEILCQIDGIDFDLVPDEAQGMIPNEAAPLRSLS